MVFKQIFAVWRRWDPHAKSRIFFTLTLKLMTPWNQGGPVLMGGGYSKCFIVCYAWRGWSTFLSDIWILLGLKRSLHMFFMAGGLLFACLNTCLCLRAYRHYLLPVQIYVRWRWFLCVYECVLLLSHFNDSKYFGMYVGCANEAYPLSAKHLLIKAEYVWIWRL